MRTVVSSHAYARFRPARELVRDSCGSGPVARSDWNASEWRTARKGTLIVMVAQDAQVSSDAVPSSRCPHPNNNIFFGAIGKGAAHFCATEASANTAE